MDAKLAQIFPNWKRRNNAIIAGVLLVSASITTAFALAAFKPNAATTAASPAAYSKPWNQR